MLMEEKGLRTKANQDAIFEASKEIDSSARINYNNKGEWHVLLYHENPAEDRASIWVAPRHIRIYGGKHTRIYDKLPDEPKYKYSYKERRITFDSVEETLAFIHNKLHFVNSVSSMSINTPLPPKDMSADGFVIICPKCNNKFQRAERCPDCGQLIKYEEG